MRIEVGGKAGGHVGKRNVGNVSKPGGATDLIQMLKLFTWLGAFLLAAWVVYWLAIGTHPFTFEAFGIKGSSG